MTLSRSKDVFVVISGVPVGVRNPRPCRTTFDGIGVISGVSTTVSRQSNEVRGSCLFRVTVEGRVTRVWTDLRPSSVSRTKKRSFVGLSSTPMRWVRTTRIRSHCTTYPEGRLFWTETDLRHPSTSMYKRVLRGPTTRSNEVGWRRGSVFSEGPTPKVCHRCGDGLETLTHVETQGGPIRTYYLVH